MRLTDLRSRICLILAGSAVAAAAGFATVGLIDETEAARSDGTVVSSAR